MDDAIKPELDSVWRALADPNRRSLLDGLRRGPRTTGDLAIALPGLTRFAVMKHLSVLEGAGLITVRREGRKRFNQLNAVPLRQIYERWVSRFEDQWAGSLLSLRRLVETQSHEEHTMESPTIRSFVFEVSLKIAAPPERVFEAWFDRAADWFYESEETRHWQKAVVERELGGRFYMINTDGPKKGKLNLLAHITMIEPGKKLRLRGDFTMPQAIVANATVSFEPAASGCRVVVDHRMIGECDEDAAKGFAEGWLDGLTKLQTILEQK